jgi:signal transduction histidine kinase
MERKIGYKHPLLLSAILFFSYTVHSQKTIADRKTDLEKATSIKAKADISSKIANDYTYLLKIDSAIYFANKTREYSRQINYETGIGEYHLVFAEAILFRGQNEEAETNVRKALDIFARQKETNLIGQSYFVLGNISYMRDNIPLARKNYRAAITNLESTHNISGLYSVYFWMARTYSNTSETDSASFYGIKALSMAEKINDADKIYTVACSVGTTFLNLGELDKAIKYFEYGLKSIAPKTNKVGLRIFLTDYATCLVLTHQFTRADSVIKEIESLNALFRDDYSMAIINKLRGTIEYERKNYQSAILYLQPAIDKIEELKFVNEDTKDIELLLGKARYALHDYDGAISNLQKTIYIAGNLRDLIAKEEANLLISKSFQQKANTDSALHYFKNYAVLKDSLFSDQKQKSIIEVTTRYETEKKEQQIKLLQGENELGAYQLRLKNGEIEKQNLLDVKKSQQLMLLAQQNEINRLQASENEVALQRQEKEILKKQNELALLGKEKELQSLLANKQSRQKNLAYGAGVIILLLGSYAFYRAGQNKKLSSQLTASMAELKQAEAQLIKSEREKEAESIRSRISRDIHDEVGATLSGVALYSQIAMQKMEQHNDKEAQIYLDHISNNSKEMIEKMGDLVWAINPGNDSMDRIAEKLKSYAVNLCVGKGIRIDFQIDEELKNYLPPMQERKNIYLLGKEAINNAVKYSGGSSIIVSAKKNKNKILLTVKDDGKGFNTDLIVRGNGLNNMQARATEMIASFNLQSKPGHGTSIKLEFPFHPNGG